MNELFGAVRAATVTAGSGGGGNTYCNVQPPEGEVWKLKALVCSQDDAARTMNMGWCDVIGSLIMPMYTELAVGAAQIEDFFANVKHQGDIYANHDCYPFVYFAAMAAAKTITVYVVYERVVGVPTMNGA